MRSGQLRTHSTVEPVASARAVPACERRLAVLVEDHVGDHARLGARELLGADALLDELGKHRVERFFELGQGDAGPRARVEAEARRIERRALVPAAGAGGDALLHHQGAIEAAGRAVAEDLGKHVEGFRFSRRGGRVGGHEVAAVQARLRDARVGERDETNRDRGRFLRPQSRADLTARRDLAVGLLGEGLDLRGLHVAGDHQDGVVGRVEAPIEGQRVLAVELLDLVAPADHRPAVRVVEIERGGDLLAEARSRVVGDALVILLENHLKLGPHLVVGQRKAGHAIGLEVHQGREMLARRALEIGRVVGRREGVFLPAEGRDGAAEVAERILGGALEHQVFEEMGDAGLAGRLVGRADLVPHHVSDDRRAVVGNDDYVQAVREREMGDALAGFDARLRRRRETGRKDHRKHPESLGKSIQHDGGHPFAYVVAGGCGACKKRAHSRPRSPRLRGCGRADRTSGKRVNCSEREGPPDSWAWACISAARCHTAGSAKGSGTRSGAR